METQSPQDSDRLRITLHGHSCAVIELRNSLGAWSRFLLDPGNLSNPLQDIGRIDAVLVTHAHPDHFDPQQLKGLVAQGPVVVYGPEGVEAMLGDLDLAVIVPQAGALDISGVSVEVASSPHETIYPGLPLPENLTYNFGGMLFVPGDSFAQPTRPVEVLLAPIAGPWMKLSESIEYVRAVAPKQVIPIHDAGLSAAHRSLHRSMLKKFAGDSEVYDLETGVRLLL